MSTASKRGRPLRVLVCEDQGLTALRLQSVLSGLGYDVVGCAANGEDAVDLAVGLRPDVILMDVQMPGLSGIQALEQVMQRMPTAVVMLTGCADEPTIQRALDAGASAYLTKPFRDQQLAPALSLAAARFRELQGERAAFRRLSTEVAQQIAEAVRRAESLTSELRREQTLARALAESFLCPAPQIRGILIDTCYEPASEWQLVGGDYFDFFDLGDSRVGVVVGECGKGVPAAALTAVARHTLRAYALEDPSPARVVGRLNRALCEYTNDDCAFVTLVYGVLDLASFSFIYTNAGHPSPVLCGPAGAGRLLEPTGGLLGIEHGWRWEAAAVAIPPGGALALFSDGLTEARCGPLVLGESGAKEALCRAVAGRASNIATALKDHAREFAGGRLSDDVVIVVLRRGDVGEQGNRTASSSVVSTPGSRVGRHPEGAAAPLQR